MARACNLIENWIVIPFIGLAVAGLVAYDRRDPLSFISGEIIPHQAQAGAKVSARITTDWHRVCEAVVSRETIGADLIVRPYLKFELRIPTRLGRQTATNEFILSEALPPGTTAYRATLRFHGCGLSSLVWPLAIETPTIFFEVAR